MAKKPGSTVFAGSTTTTETVDFNSGQIFANGVIENTDTSIDVTIYLNEDAATVGKGFPLRAGKSLSWSIPLTGYQVDRGFSGFHHVPDSGSPKVNWFVYE